MSYEEPSTTKGRSLHTDNIMQLFASDDEGSFSGFKLDNNNNNLAADILDQASQNMSTLPQCSNKLTEVRKAQENVNRGSLKRERKPKSKE